MAAGEPSEGSDRRPRRGWWIAAGLLAGLLVVGLVVLWIQAPALYGRGDAAKTAAATTRGAILTVAAALIAATAAGAGLYMTARTIWINQQALAETQRANRAFDEREREAQVTDRYTKAIGQLGDPQLAIRLGGIYALERIAVDSERDHRTVVEVLSAFVRNSSQPAASNRSPVLVAPPAGNTGQTLATDVQAAVTVLGRLPSRPGVPRGDLTDAHLTGARLFGANLAGAWLNGANLTDAWLNEANLTSAQLGEANLTGARLDGANLTDAGLGGADLTHTRFTGANLTGARLDGADLTGARLARANLIDADLTGANLTQQQLDSARGDDRTKLPEQPPKLRRPAHWSAGLAVPPTADP